MKNILTSVADFHPAVEEIDWQEVYDHCLPRVYHFFCYKVGNSVLAEDLSAITFEKAWLSRRNFRKDIGLMPAWLMGIARNVASDHFRKRFREIPLEDESDRSFMPSFDEDLQQKLDFQFILSILAQYPERERELIALKYGAELTNREIARLAGLSETNVGTILHRVVEKLKVEWEKNHER
jgi:RNA polymerase sigma-70 factor (ECF subfamily)